MTGVGGSAGRASWTGAPETTDVCNCIRWLVSDDGAPEVKHVERVFVCGYSFGAAVGCSAVAGCGADQYQELTDAIAGVAAISYPCGWLSWFLLGGHNKHVRELGFLDRDRILFTIGTADQWASARQVRNLAATIPPATTEGNAAATGNGVRVEVVEGADHFFFGDEERVVRPVLAWLVKCAADAEAHDDAARL